MINVDHKGTPRTVAEPKPYQNRTPEERMTCEQRRAREYGIDNDPEPQPFTFSDPLVYAITHNEWEARQNRKAQEG